MPASTLGRSAHRPPKDAPKQLSGNLGDRRHKPPVNAFPKGVSGNPKPAEPEPISLM
jgi:hypothetical protein